MKTIFTGDYPTTKVVLDSDETVHVYVKGDLLVSVAKGEILSNPEWDKPLYRIYDYLEIDGQIHSEIMERYGEIKDMDRYKKLYVELHKSIGRGIAEYRVLEIINAIRTYVIEKEDTNEQE